MSRHVLEKMSRAEVLARAAEKRGLLMSFLASGEAYTSLKIAADIMGVSQRAARDTLKALVRDSMIKVEDGLPQKLYGLTSHGIALTENAHSAVREFQIGKSNPAYVNHHLQTQIVRLAASASGWTSWVPGKILYSQNATRLKKLPDSIGTRSDGRVIAFEVENYVKSQKRLEVVMGLHLQQITAGHYQIVYYLTPHPDAQRRAFDKINFVPVDGLKIKLTDAHRQRFVVHGISEWKGE